MRTKIVKDLTPFLPALIKMLNRYSMKVGFGIPMQTFDARIVPCLLCKIAKMIKDENYCHACPWVVLERKHCNDVMDNVEVSYDRTQTQED